MNRKVRASGGAVLLASVALAGCARAPEYSVTASGAIPGPRTSYRLAQPEGEAPSLPPEVEAALATALDRQGLAKASSAEKPQLILFAGLARRPGGTGAFTRANPADSGEAPGWIATPDEPGRQVTTLALRFVDPATGAPVRSVRAEARHSKRQQDAVIASLVQGAATGEPLSAPKR